MIVAIACMLSVIGVKIIESFRSVFNIYRYVPTEEAQQAAKSGVIYMRLLVLVLWPLGAFYSLEDILDYIYSRTGKEKVQVKLCELIVDLGILISVILLCFSYDLSLLKFDEKSLADYHATMLAINTNYTIETYFAVFSSCIWIKVLYHFRLNSLFGPLLTIFSHMSQIIVQFSLLIILLILTFAFSGRIMFSVGRFESFYESLMTLFSWMLGEFSFDSMSSEGWKGEVFMALYLLVCMVLMMNLLIALLSTTYSNLSS